MSTAQYNDTNLLSVDDAREQFFGNNASVFSIRRWIAKGVGTPSVKLKAIRLGGRYFLRECDIQEFLEAQSDPELYRRRQQTTRVAKAKKRLRKAGV